LPSRQSRATELQLEVLVELEQKMVAPLRQSTDAEHWGVTSFSSGRGVARDARNA
jgi:hypothetical protein